MLIRNKGGSCLKNKKNKERNKKKEEKEMGKKSEKIWVEKRWFNGKIVNPKETVINIDSGTANYGYGLFEGLRSYYGLKGIFIFKLKEHIERLFNSARLEYLEIPFSKSEIENACIEVVKANGLEEWYIRPQIFVDTQAQMGLGPIEQDCVKVAIRVWKMGAYLGEGLKEGITLKTSSRSKSNNGLLIPQSKSIANYTGYNRAKMEALKLGYNEALLLDGKGFVAEGSAENIFFVKRGIIVTPSAASSILMGITRKSIIEIARDKGYEVVERDFDRGKLYIADEVFLTGTAAEVTPVREIDDIVIGSGKPGPITLDLQKTFFDAVQGKLEEYRHWLTPI